MAIDTVIHTNEHSVDRVLNAGVPVLLVFWRGNIQASTEMDSALADLAQRYAGKALIAKIDAGDEAGLVKRFNISQIPTLVFAKDGQVEAIATGAANTSELSAWLDYLINGGAKPPLPGGISVPINGAAAPQQTNTNGKAGHGEGQPRPQSTGDGKPVKLTDTNFDRYVSGPGPVLVDFWAPWCGPCRMIAPALEQMAQEFQGQAVIGKLNVDENQVISRRYNIMSIPTLYIFKHGQVVDQIVGAQPAQTIRQRLMQQM